MQVYVQSLGNGIDAVHFPKLAKRVESDFSRHARQIKNVDVLIVADGDDKGCIMEAQVVNADPITVRSHAATFEQAIDKGADKIEQVLESRNHHLEPIQFPDRDEDLRNPVREIPLP